MPRSDNIGIFWQDIPPVKPPKLEKVKRSPPDPIWLDAAYLPGLEEARKFPVHIMSSEELIAAAANKEELIVDIELYPNYFLVCFTSKQTGYVFFLECWEGGHQFDSSGLAWILTNFTTVGFNSRNFDIPLCWIALTGASIRTLKNAADEIILGGAQTWQLLKSYKAEALDIDHIDLIEVAPLRASLKGYAGRLHAHKMQDLPFHPNTHLNWDQITIVRWYCVNDILNTKLLRECLDEHIALRYTLSRDYGVDVRSKSDAQIAEVVIGAELKKLTGYGVKRPNVPEGSTFYYQVPNFIKYQSNLLNWALQVVRTSQFVIDFNGSPALPEEIKNLAIDINGSVYRMGIGGLHSSEQTVSYKTNEEYILVDKDVTSYYPFITLNLGLFPPHIGKPFLRVLRKIVDRRVMSKKAGERVIADSLKIVVNGAFGKYGSKWSILYAPNLLIQVTVTGQLLLLMLIERIELAGIHVVSANTDGIVIRCPRNMRDSLDEIVRQWEQDTGFETEETIYSALYSRDVNNYIAIKEDGKTKTKGAYANPWSSTKNLGDRLHKNPTSTICVEAVEQYLTKGTPVEYTIEECKDITKFVVVRNVKGGAVKIWPEAPPEYMGKAVRWYYAAGVGGEIVYASSGNKVPRSDGAKPLMALPEVFPADIDYEWYIKEAVGILYDIGAVPRPPKPEKKK